MAKIAESQVIVDFTKNVGGSILARQWSGEIIAYFDFLTVDIAQTYFWEYTIVTQGWTILGKIKRHDVDGEWVGVTYRIM